MNRYVDLSQTVFDGLVTYKGLPAPKISDYLSREASRANYTPGTEFQIGRIEMVTNTGTYIDFPFHRFANGKDTSEIALDAIVDVEGIVIRADYRNGLAVDADAFFGKDIQNKAVLVHTGWATHFGNERYFTEHPFLTANAAEYLWSSGAKIVGIDSHNIDVYFLLDKIRSQQ